MKNFFIIFICCLIVCIKSILLDAAISKTAIPLLYNETKIFIGLYISHEQILPPIKFPVQPSNTSSDKAIKLLATYYSNAKSNNANILNGLYAPMDGSKDTIQRMLALNSDIYSNYRQLEHIQIYAKTHWGGYQFIDVLLSGNNEIIEWREDVLCDNNDCKMSIKYDSSDEKERFLEAVLLWTSVFLNSSYDQNKLNTQMATLKAHNNNISIYPDYLPGALLINPITIYFHLTQLNDNLFTIDQQEASKTESIPPPEVQTLINMINDTAKSDRYNIETKLTPYWTSMPGGGLCRMTENENGSYSNTSSEKLQSIAYTWEAFYDRVIKWNKIRIIGFAELEDITFLFVEPIISETEKDSIQLFTVLHSVEDNSYKLLTDNDQVIPWHIFRNADIMQFIYETYH